LPIIDSFWGIAKKLVKERWTNGDRLQFEEEREERWTDEDSLQFEE
jgi:hypothetical protein